MDKKYCFYIDGLRRYFLAIISDIYSLVYLLKSSSDNPVNNLTSIKYIMTLDSVMVSDVMDDVITPTMENYEVELLIIASIQTLKRKNKRRGRDEVFELVKDSTYDDTVTKETFDKLLNQLINNNSVKLNTVGNRECLSLPTKSNKKNQQSHI